MKNARRMLEVPMEAAMLCNRGTKSEEWEADDFRTERDKRPAKAVVSLLQSVQRKPLNYW